MKKILLILLFAFTTSLAFSQTSISRYVVVGHLNDTLKIVDTTNFSVIHSVKMTCDSFIKGATGLVRHPQTGVYYIMLRFIDLDNRYLGTVNPATGVCTIIGSVGDRMSNIVFLPSGKMYGVTGNGALTPESLFSINITTGAATFVRTLGAGSGGEAIGYCPDDGQIYHRSGIGSQAYEKIDTTLFNIIPLPMINNPNTETFCMLYKGHGVFETIDLNYDVITIDTSGNFTYKQTLSQPYKGIEFLNCQRNITGTLSFCAGSSTILTATAGATAYQWYKNGVLMAGKTSSTLSVNAAGKYNCFISDLCGADSLLASVTVALKSLPIVTLSGANGFCAGGNVVLTGSSGGTSQWYKNGAAIIGATSNSYTANTAGLYNMIKTNTNGCFDSAAVGKTIVVYALPNAQINPASSTICSGDNVTLTASGGTSYLWNTTDNTAAITVSPTSSTTYSVTVTNANNCSASTSRLVNVNQLPIAAINPATVTICKGANATLTASGGTSYLWNTTAISAAITVSPLSNTTYSVTVTDANNCSATASKLVTVNALPSVSVSGPTEFCQGSSVQLTGTSGGTNQWYKSGVAISGATSSTYNVTIPGHYNMLKTNTNGCKDSAAGGINVSQNLKPNANLASARNLKCNGDNSGSIDIAITSGTPPFTYSWSNGAIFQSIANLPAGNYQLIVTDSKTCGDTVNAQISEPPAIQLSLSSTDVLCNAGNSGTANATLSGGSGILNYSWSNGGIALDNLNLSAATYTFSVSDDSLCSKIDSVIITEPTVIQISSNQTDILCNGGNTGAADVSVSGGTGGYTYSWSTGDIVASLTNLVAGNYSVVVTDANACSSIKNIQLNEPLPIVLSVSSGPVSCNLGNDGFAQAIASGGTGNLTYSWENALGNLSIINNLAANTYTVFVNDDNGCSKIDSISISEPTPIIQNITVQDVTCNGFDNGSIQVTPTGGTGPYAYSWSTGATSALLSNLPGANYDLVITDLNSCTSSAQITVNEPAAISIQSYTIVNTPVGIDTGSVSIAVQGGTPPYTYSWNNGQTTQNCIGLAVGTYSVFITDAQGCTFQSPTYSILIDAISKNISNDGIQVFPNPNNGSFQLKTPVAMHFQLFNSMSQLVAELHTDANKVFEFDNAIPAGIYYLKSVNANQIYNQKIVVN